MAVTLDTATKSADITLSGGSLTLTCTGTANLNSTTRSTVAPTGLLYCEFKPTVGAAGNNNIGLCNASQSNADWLGPTANGMGYEGGGGVWCASGSTPVATIQTYTVGDVTAQAWNTTSRLAWWKNLTTGSFWNNSPTANPATGVGGIPIGVTGPLFVALDTSALGDASTINFGRQTLIGTVPSGFSVVDPATGSPYTLAGATGAFTLTGKAAAFKRTYRLGGVTGAFALTGNAAALAKGGRLLAGVTGIFILSGNNATLTYSGAPAATATETPFWRRRRRS